MATRGGLARAAASLRKHALAYPEAYEEFPWGEHAFKVNKKVFLFLTQQDDFLHLSVKLPVSGPVALGLPFATPTGYGLGKSGWVTARFEKGQDVPVEMLKEWVDESFRTIAPKKVVATLENPSEEEPAPRRRASR